MFLFSGFYHCLLLLENRSDVMVNGGNVKPWANLAEPKYQAERRSINPIITEGVGSLRMYLRHRYI